MSYGKVYFARNSTGVKLGFTKKPIKRGINDNCNLSMVVDNFTLIEYISVKKPKSVKSLIEDEIISKNINRDLYDMTNDSIQKLCDKYRQNLEEDSDYESDDEEYESDYEESDLDDDDDEESELDEDEFIVEKIVSYTGGVKNPKTLLFNVKWKEYPSSQNTMEPFENLKDCIIFHKYIDKTPSLHFLKKKITHVI